MDNKKVMALQRTTISALEILGQQIISIAVSGQQKAEAWFILDKFRKQVAEVLKPYIKEISDSLVKDLDSMENKKAKVGDWIVTKKTGKKHTIENEKVFDLLGFDDLQRSMFASDCFKPATLRDFLIKSEEDPKEYIEIEWSDKVDITAMTEFTDKQLSKISNLKTKKEIANKD